MFTYELSDFCTRYDLNGHDLHRILADFNGYMIAGGAVRALLQNLPVTTDIDVFFRNEAEKDEFIRTFAPEEKTVTKLHTTFKYSDYTVQAIYIDYYANIEECLSSFDYTICQCGIDRTRLVVGPYTLWDLARKKLVVNKITYGAASVRRMLKYAKQGFTVCQGTISALLNEIADDPDKIRSEVAYVD